MAKQNELDLFGKILMEEVRDQVINNWDKICDGTLKGKTATRVREIISSSDGKIAEVLSEVLPLIVDNAIHNLMWSLEQEDSIKLMVSADDGADRDIAKESDGLSGELYGANGWIARFSNERHDEA